MRFDLTPQTSVFVATFGPTLHSFYTVLGSTCSRTPSQVPRPQALADRPAIGWRSIASMSSLVGNRSLNVPEYFKFAFSDSRSVAAAMHRRSSLRTRPLWATTRRPCHPDSPQPCGTPLAARGDGCTQRSRLERAVGWIAVSVLVVHGLIHVMGFAKALELSSVEFALTLEPSATSRPPSRALRRSGRCVRLGTLWRTRGVRAGRRSRPWSSSSPVIPSR